MEKFDGQLGPWRERWREVLERIPPEHLARLEGLLETHSGAHVLEALKRARVLGWDHPGSDEDITFE